jgi:hypothetical protein
MKFLKTKNISRFSISDNTYIQNLYGRITIDSTNSLLLPKGTAAQRPDTSTIPNLNGAIRYNTDTNTLEGYINSVWTNIRAPGATAISKQTIGPGDLVETIFGPLNTVPAGTSYLASINNIIVLVENVFQIGTTNFIIVQNPAGIPAAAFYGGAGSYPAGYYLEFADAIPVGKYVTVFYGYAD